MQTKLRYMPNKNNKYLPIYLHANFVASPVIGWKKFESCQPITALGIKLAHVGKCLFLFGIYLNLVCINSFICKHGISSNRNINTHFPTNQ